MQARPKEIAYRMIKDHLTLDGNPVLNLASFVTTYMVTMDFSMQMLLVNTRFRKKKSKR